MQSGAIQLLKNHFDALSQRTPDEDVEFWFARDLMEPLGYVRWENFQSAINRAIESCETTGYRADDHFRNVTKMIEIGKGGQRSVDDFMLTRYACYLIAQNGDPRKEPIAFAQSYLPKALYPFNSINFRNLAPACHECNSTYKLSKDPAHSATGRRKAFYPYTATPYVIELQVTLQHSDIANLMPADVNLQFGPAALAENIDTWKDVYGIEESYKAKFCAENDGKYWLTQVLDEWPCNGKSPADFMTTLLRQATSKPYAECNFLKKPFLDACHRVGLLDAIAKGENAP